MPFSLDAEKLFMDNVNWNKALAKRKAKPRQKNSVYLAVRKMSPDEIIDRLKKMEVSMSRKTLYNYEKWELICPPKFRNSRTTDYPDEALAEAYASWNLIHGPLKPTLELVAKARKKALIIESKNAETTEELIRIIMGDVDNGLWAKWWGLKLKVENGKDPTLVDRIRKKLKLIQLGMRAAYLYLDNGEIEPAEKLILGASEQIKTDDDVDVLVEAATSTIKKFMEAEEE